MCGLCVHVKVYSLYDKTKMEGGLKRKVEKNTPGDLPLPFCS